MRVQGVNDLRQVQRYQLITLHLSCLAVECPSMPLLHISVFAGKLETIYNTYGATTQLVSWRKWWMRLTLGRDEVLILHVNIKPLNTVKVSCRAHMYLKSCFGWSPISPPAASVDVFLALLFPMMDDYYKGKPRARDNIRQLPVKLQLVLQSSRIKP